MIQKLLVPLWLLTYCFCSCSTNPRQVVGSYLDCVNQYHSIRLSDLVIADFAYAVRAYLHNSEFVATRYVCRTALKADQRLICPLWNLRQALLTRWMKIRFVLTRYPLSGSLPMPLSIIDENSMTGQSVMGTFTFSRVIIKPATTRTPVSHFYLSK